VAIKLTIYDIIKRPVFSEKAYHLNQKLGQLMLYVHPQANRVQIKQAVEKLFDVQVMRVNVDIRKGKTRRVGRRKVCGSTKKRAIIKLAPGYSLDMFKNAEANAQEARQSS
jgi:large subunit ribosomal protein L23